MRLHDVAAQVRGYLVVFGALLVLTVVTVGVSYLHLPRGRPSPSVIAIALVKAALVAMFFMHLKGEKPMVYWPLGLTAFLFVGLFAEPAVAEGDHLFGTQFGDAFTIELGIGAQESGIRYGLPGLLRRRRRGDAREPERRHRRADGRDGDRARVLCAFLRHAGAAIA